MIQYRVTVLTRRPDGTDHATIHGPFDHRAEAGRFADDARREQPDATVDVVALDERGNPLRDHGQPARTDRSDAAMVGVFDQWAARRQRADIDQ